eukprot:Platyproteum_vivax@DN6178_c0_g1_i1.p1
MAEDSGFNPAIAKHDISHSMMPFLDPHLAIPIINYSAKFTGERIKNLRTIQVLKGATMLQYINDLKKQTGQEHDQNVTSAEKQILSVLDQKEGLLYKFNEAFVKASNEIMLQTGTQEAAQIVDSLIKDDLFPRDVLDQLAEIGRYTYNCGVYANSVQALEFYISAAGADPNLQAQRFSALWGRFAAKILMTDYDPELLNAEIQLIDQSIENQRLSKKQLLTHRLWLLHWSLFLLFHPGKNFSRPETLDWFFNDKNVAAVAIGAPHMFRYYAVLLVLHKRIGSKHAASALSPTSATHLLIQASQNSTYQDPFVWLIEALIGRLDFESAQMALQECRAAAEADKFVFPHWDEFLDNTRLLVFECYCRVHSSINIGMLATRLNMEPVAAENWIVNLIRNARLDARIDSENNRVVMATQIPDVYAQVLDRTKTVYYKSGAIYSKIAPIMAMR